MVQLLLFTVRGDVFLVPGWHEDGELGIPQSIPAGTFAPAGFQSRRAVCKETELSRKPDALNWARV